ncbi:MAG: hypothetical protein ACREBU_01440 [Nitrososphaera sp.]
MTQRTRAKQGGPSTLAILLVVVVAAVLGLVFQDANRGRGPADEDTTEQVTISVVFKPADRVDYPVHVLAHVESVEIINDLVVHSPGNWVIVVPRGAQVSVHAQQDIDGELDCLIQVNGITVDHNHRDTLGSIRCWHNRQG